MQLSSRATLRAQEGPLLKVRAPVLFVCGGRDALCPQAALTELQQRLECGNDALVLEVSSCAAFFLTLALLDSLVHGHFYMWLI